MKLIEFKNVSLSFNNTRVLEDISLDLEEGECLGLVGGSGAGKSVLLRSTIGLESIDQGKILIEGKDISKFKERELFPIRKKISYVFQWGALFDNLTVFENIAYPLIEHSTLTELQIKKRVEYEINELELQNSESLYPAQISGGMQKRVGIARSIILDPKVILYDEPTTGLDPYNVRNMERIMTTLKERGTSSILVTHDMKTALKLCDRMALLADGSIKTVQTPSQFEKDKDPLLTNFIEGIKGV